MDKIEYKLGQKLWLDPRSNRAGRGEEGRLVTVKKIGRKYVEFDVARYGKPLKVAKDETSAFYEKGFYTGDLWLSEERYKEVQAIRSVWRDLKSDMDRLWHAPEGVTREDVEKARKLLRVARQEKK